ncbi:hypothetical protein Ocin01_05008 [Orchesella cincta]|uniref:Uncharacterized protein n=1 Tax=Orchesella cincta TaxID=48709 RepID=A0A1D2N9J5_ORCCI|nr:hypothetical protein Ocin01_05008 [Orchesella cincta]
MNVILTIRTMVLSATIRYWPLEFFPPKSYGVYPKHYYSLFLLLALMFPPSPLKISLMLINLTSFCSSSQKKKLPLSTFSFPRHNFHVDV